MHLERRKERRNFAVCCCEMMMEGKKERNLMPVRSFVRLGFGMVVGDFAVVIGTCSKIHRKLSISPRYQITKLFHHKNSFMLFIVLTCCNISGKLKNSAKENLSYFGLPTAIIAMGASSKNQIGPKIPR